MAASLFGVGLWLAGAAAPAQEPPPTLHLPYIAPSNGMAVKTLHFTKQPDPPPPPPLMAVPEKVIHLGKDPTTAPELERGLQPAGMQQPKEPPRSDARVPGEESQGYQVQLEPPGPQRLYRLESENALHTRMEQEARERPRPERLEFPDYRPLSTETRIARVWGPLHLPVEPNYVCYGRLEFEEINSERFGWEIGFLQPFISAGWFYWDLVALPYHAFSEPCRRSDCSAGYCLPGDPVPYLLYPPGASGTGALAQAAAVVSLIAIFP